MAQIPIYSEINESHAATGFTGRTDLPDFHIFTIEETYPSTRQVMPPYRLGFYQIGLLDNSSDAAIEFNAERVNQLNNMVTFASPEHVVAWVRGEAQVGYMLFFKADLLAHYPFAVPDRFPFFRLTQMNQVKVSHTDCLELREQYARLHEVFHSDHPYRQPVLASLVVALLYDCKRLYDQQEAGIAGTNPQHALAYRFQQFVNQHYLTHQTVQSYAQLMSLSPDYLGEVVKEATGKTPLTFIQERVLLEAKRLLAYSDLNVSEIATYLGYAEPTHFGRFFKGQIGTSPGAWREQRPELP